MKLQFKYVQGLKITSHLEEITNFFVFEFWGHTGVSLGLTLGSVFNVLYINAKDLTRLGVCVDTHLHGSTLTLVL